ncbi:Aste57867_14161 [Aphanomyces stellatus]|uniref:ubiquitinyl hydrolase 1 n=1 Tax=Aphanomyces stellatus TaxID=120398 RepID=A0A485L277_9STRA|nr:hypothetical protein As57867_014110 [Aphanomyces stellatus]VFT90987.1 Aste57867_14161 [Aphanomyces stellatus]
MFSIRVRSPKGVAVVQIAPLSTFQEFQEKALAALSLRPTARGGFMFRGGFPPKEIHADADAAVESIFQKNDTVVIEPVAISAHVPRQSKATQKKFAGVGVKLGAVPSSEGETHVPPPTTTGSTGEKVVAIKVVPNRKRFQGAGVRLSDTADTSTPPPLLRSTPAAAPKRKAIHLGSKEDVEMNLVQAVRGGGGGSSTADKFMRKATKAAVVHQYDMTLANARLQAAWGSQYSMQMMDGGKMKVRFLARSRTWTEEVVDCLQPTEIQAAIKYVVLAGGGDKEMLKPFNMAQVSPRVFWSLARLYSGNVERGLQTLLPDEDWAFLDTRTRTLSAKAMEAQATGGGRWRKEEPDVLPPIVDFLSDDDDGSTLVASQETTVPHVDAKAVRNAAARAALARLHQHTRPDTAAPPPPPTEAPIVDEDIETTDATITVLCDNCGKARVVSAADRVVVGIADDAPWMCNELVRVGRSGGCAMPDDELVRLVESARVAACLDALGVHGRAQLANADMELVFSAWRRQFPHDVMSLDVLEAHVEEARFQELDDRMQEIVGDADVVHHLEASKVATPYDLRTTPGDLILRELAPKFPTFSIKEVEAWQAAAAAAMEAAPWMDEWRSV